MSNENESQKKKTINAFKLNLLAIYDKVVWRDEGYISKVSK